MTERVPAQPGGAARDRSPVVVLTLLAASALCVAVDEYRTHHLGDPYYRFLIWNLILAWVPLGFAVLAYVCARRGLRVSAVFGVLWLLFFPNAPYMLTDFIHLGENAAAPVWYDALMLSAFAWTALLLGFASLYVMQLVWRRAVGSAWSWLGVVCVLAIGSFGVYVGRFMQLNSWDALLHPVRVFDVIRSNVENPLTHPRLAGSLLALAASLIIGYAIVYSVAGTRLELEQRRRL
jgi:uncharacterized membrane protein